MPRVSSAPHLSSTRRALDLLGLRALDLRALDRRLSPRGVGSAAAAVLLSAAVGAASLVPPPAASGPVQATSAGSVQLLDLPSPSPSPSAVASAPPSPPAARPAPRPARAAAPAVPVRRWLPTGTGMWLHDWSRSEKGHADVVVRKATAAGLTHLYVQTGSSRKGWIGTPVLSQLLPATKGTGLKVIAWDFPKLVQPEADARRLARAATFRRPGAPRVAAVAPDVETGAEGTRLSAAGIDRYYRTLRAALPKDVAIIATVPWPSEHRVNRYPYDRTMRYADAVAPMAYWYNRPAGTVTATSMRWFRRFGKPVIPVGQGYDGRIDAPYLAPDLAPDRSVQAFVDEARKGGAPAVSLWSWQTTGPLQWGVLVRSAGFPARPAPSPSPSPLPSMEPLPTVAATTAPGPPSPAPTPLVAVSPEPSPSP